MRAIATAPSIVEKITMKARCLSAARRPGIKGSIRFLIFRQLSKDLGFHRLIGPRQLGRKGRQGAPALGVITAFRAP
jgi:hypothetical protein